MSYDPAVLTEDDIARIAKALEATAPREAMNQLTAARIESGITVAETATRMGVVLEVVQLLELPAPKPPLHLVFAYARAIRVAVSIVVTAGQQPYLVPHLPKGPRT